MLAAVLDSSVVVKWFRQGEVLAQQALALRQDYLEGAVLLFAPTLLSYEVANVLRYKSDLSPVQVDAAVQSLFDMELEWVQPSKDLLRRAVDIAVERDVTVYDASFAAVAEAVGGTLITADVKLADQLNGMGLARFLGNLLEEQVQ